MRLPIKLYHILTFSSNYKKIKFWYQKKSFSILRFFLNFDFCFQYFDFLPNFVNFNFEIFTKFYLFFHFSEFARIRIFTTLTEIDSSSWKTLATNSSNGGEQAPQPMSHIQIGNCFSLSNGRADQRNKTELDFDLQDSPLFLDFIFFDFLIFLTFWFFWLFDFFFDFFYNFLLFTLPTF